MSNLGNTPQIMLMAPELSSVMDGTDKQIGSTGLLYNPYKIIFDNQGTVAVAIKYSNDGVNFNTWRTFPAGEALVLDDELGAFSIGTKFYGNGASGTFSISYVYLKIN